MPRHTLTYLITPHALYSLGSNTLLQSHFSFCRHPPNEPAPHHHTTYTPTHTRTHMLQWKHAQLSLTRQADQEPSLLISIAHTRLGSLEFGRHIFYLSKQKAAEPLEHHRPLEGSKVVKWVDGDRILRKSCLLIVFFSLKKFLFFLKFLG